MKSSTKRVKTYGLTLPKIRFQADADLNEDIVTGVLRREPSIDFQTAGDANLQGLDDDQVLKLVADQYRILVTHDRQTMPRHFADFITREASPGILIVSQKESVATVIDELIMIWSASEAEEYVNRICTIPL
jgi:hypothetical protein